MTLALIAGPWFAGAATLPPGSSHGTQATITIPEDIPASDSEVCRFIVVAGTFTITPADIGVGSAGYVGIGVNGFPYVGQVAGLGNATYEEVTEPPLQNVYAGGCYPDWFIMPNPNSNLIGQYYGIAHATCPLVRYLTRPLIAGNTITVAINPTDSDSTHSYNFTTLFALVLENALAGFLSSSSFPFIAFPGVGGYITGGSGSVTGPGVLRSGSAGFTGSGINPGGSYGVAPDGGDFLLPPDVYNNGTPTPLTAIPTGDLLQLIYTDASDIVNATETLDSTHGGTSYWSVGRGSPSYEGVTPTVIHTDTGVGTIGGVAGAGWTAEWSYSLGGGVTGAQWASTGALPTPAAGYHWIQDYPTRDGTILSWCFNGSTGGQPACTRQIHLSREVPL